MNIPIPKFVPETNRTIVKWFVGGIVLIVLFFISVCGYLIYSGSLDSQDIYDIIKLILEKRSEVKA
jgi:hypothetical protein